MYDFVAIDFETATSRVSSACAVGIVAVKELKPVEQFYSLIYPPENKYDERNIAIHHITPELTENAPTLTELWPQIRCFFDVHVPIVAHSAGFDVSVLRLSTDESIPDFMYVDSMILASPFCGSSQSLTSCAEAMNIDTASFTHHNALDDAAMCAAISIEVLKREECKTMWEFLAKEPYINRKRISELAAYKKYLKAKVMNNNVRPSDVKCTVEQVDENGPLYGKNIVFTGELSIERSEAMQFAVNCGAFVKSSVSRKTDYLVVGAQDKALVGEDGLSTKEEYAYKLNNEGKANVTFLSEEQFLQLVKGEVSV